MIKFTKIISLILLFFALSTYVPKYENQRKSLIFPLQIIKVENNSVVNEQDLIKELGHLKGQNLLLIDEKAIRDQIKKFDFISSFTVNKVYPKTIKVTIFEKKPIAIYSEEKKFYFISEEGELINFIDINRYENLPVVYGKNKNFSDLYKSLVNINFPMNEIKSYQYFKIGRWDINLRNNKKIKLPKDNYIEALSNFSSIKDEKSFHNYRIFDYRIKDQLILN